MYAGKAKRLITIKQLVSFSGNVVFQSQAVNRDKKKIAGMSQGISRRRSLEVFTGSYKCKCSVVGQSRGAL